MYRIMSFAESCLCTLRSKTSPDVWRLYDSFQGASCIMICKNQPGSTKQATCVPHSIEWNGQVLCAPSESKVRVTFFCFSRYGAIPGKFCSTWMLARISIGSDCPSSSRSSSLAISFLQKEQLPLRKFNLMSNSKIWPRRRAIFFLCVYEYQSTCCSG